MKNILIINGHPNKNSYNYALANAYKSGAKEAGANISQININELDFNPNFMDKSGNKIQSEPDILDSIEKIKKADHLVWVFPTWWYSYPAMMKGFIDRTFLPGITYKYRKGSAIPAKLLKGKTARIIVTSDTPTWYNYLYMKSPATNQLKKGTLEFCGIKPVKVTDINVIRKSSIEFRENWLKKVEKLGRNLS